MKVLSEKKVTKLRIQYENSRDLSDRDAVFKYLDEKYGVLCYTVIRQGPCGDRFNEGLMIVEVE